MCRRRQSHEPPSPHPPRAGPCAGRRLAAPAVAHAFTIGISDQKLGMWQDPRFRSWASTSAPADVLRLGAEARLLALRPMDEGGDVPRRRRPADDPAPFAPSARAADVREYRRTVRILYKRYPYVKTMSAWNEANHVSQPTYRRPKRAAKYFNIMRDECHGCRIVAADVLDTKNMLPWLATFKRYATNPRIWGLHSYCDANRFRPVKLSSTRQLLRTVRAGLADRGGRASCASATSTAAAGGASHARRPPSRIRLRWPTRAAGSSGSTCITGTPTGGSSGGIRRWSRRTAGPDPRLTCCDRSSTGRARGARRRCASSLSTRRSGCRSY